MIDFGKATIWVSIICLLEALTELPLGVDRLEYCESCLAIAQEMETVERKLSVVDRPQLVERLIDDVMCETASFQEHADLPVDKFRAACKHLLDVHGEEFRVALMRRESERLDILLCYESSLACVGVKRHTDQNKTSFMDSDIERLLQENRAEVRIARPVHTNVSKMALKDEL